MWCTWYLILTSHLTKFAGRVSALDSRADGRFLLWWRKLNYQTMNTPRWQDRCLMTGMDDPWKQVTRRVLNDRHGWYGKARLCKRIYSWLLLSQPRLSRITAYLELKILSLLKLENLTTGVKNIVEKRSNFSSFPQYIQYISSFKSPITCIFKCGCSNCFFLNSANLICRGTDISKYFRVPWNSR